MKNICALFIVAALTISSGAISPLPVQAQVAETVKPQPSLEKYNEWMKKGREFKSESQRAYSVFHSTEAVRAFDQAAIVAPTSLQRAEAYVEAGESLYPMAEMPLAITAFNAALKEEISPELKGRALWGIARSEFHIAFMSQTLAKNATRLRANYEAASKARKLSDGEKREVAEKHAEIYEAEGKHIDAAREYLNILDSISDASRQGLLANDVLSQLKKASKLSPTQYADAVQVTDKFFKTYLPANKKHGGSYYYLARMDYAMLLNQFGQPARAETLWNEVANDTTVEAKKRADVLLKISQLQTAQQKFDAALKTVERLNGMDGASKSQVIIERAKILVAQNKLSLATSEYSKVLTGAFTSDEKAQAFLGLADVSEKEAEALRLKNAPEAEIKEKLDSQKRQLRLAQLPSAVSASLRHEACLKLAAWEKAHGTEAEAKNWERKAASLTYSPGK